jgi:hypothetical protein
VVTFVPPAPVPVADLGVTTAEAIWLGVPAGERQRAEALQAGLSEGPSSDLVTLSPGALASAGALRRFVAASASLEGDVVGELAEPLGAWGREEAFGDRALLVRLRGGGDATPERVAAARRVVVPVEHRVLPVKLADSPGGRSAEIPVADAVIVNASCWQGLLWANLLGLAPELLAQLLGPRWLAPIRVAWAWLRTWSADPMVIAGALTRVGSGVRIHPTAVVEACVVGDGVQIGPGAVVRFCVLGAGAVVEAQALAQFAVIGPGAHVQRQALAQFSVLHPGSAVAGAMQMGVLGPRAAVKHGATLYDQHVDGPVRASVGGRLVPAPLGVLGVGVGAGTMIASGVHVAAGRTLPPDLRVLPARGEVLTRVPPGLSGTVELRDGSLVRT